jgi:hypothetical protein
VIKRRHKFAHAQRNHKPDRHHETRDVVGDRYRRSKLVERRVAQSEGLSEAYEQHVSKLLGSGEAKKLRSLHDQLNLKLAASPPP